MKNTRAICSNDPPSISYRIFRIACIFAEASFARQFQSSRNRDGDLEEDLFEQGALSSELCKIDFLFRSTVP